MDIGYDHNPTTRDALVGIVNSTSAFLSYRDERRRRNKAANRKKWELRVTVLARDAESFRATGRDREIAKALAPTRSASSCRKEPLHCR